MKRIAALLLLAFLISLFPHSTFVASADVFVLASGGELRGELENPDETPRQRYIIRPYAGGRVSMAASMVINVIAERPIEIAYEQMKLDQEDSIQGHWQLAEWCRDNNLDAERDDHLERIIELDPDHAEARRLLGYEKNADRWMTRDQIMQQRGYVKFSGRWMLPQEVQQIEKDREEKSIRKKWFENVRRWRTWLERSDRAVKGEEYLLAIRSPHAVDALIKNLEGTINYRFKRIFAKAMANTKSLAAVDFLVKQTIEHDESPDAGENEDFRFYCLDLVEKVAPAAASAMYINALKQSSENHHINRAAIGLGRVGNASSVQPLIDHLVTRHKFQIGRGSPGQTTTTFGGGPSGQGTSFGTGGGPKVVQRYLRNADVLGALVQLTGKDFDYDTNAWKAWYSTQRPAAPVINTRRD